MKFRQRTLGRNSFTLIEMLAAMAVLTFMLLMIFSLVSSSLNVSDATGRNADSSIEAKVILDRIGSDIESMITRPDVDQLYYKSTGNDKMFFYTQQPGYYPTDANGAYYSTNGISVTLVGYRVSSIDNVKGQPMLERLAQGLVAAQDGSSESLRTQSMQYLTFPPRTSATSYASATAGTIASQWGSTVGTSGGNYDDGSSKYYDAIGPDVFRFEICFQLSNGTSSWFSQTPGYTNSLPAYWQTPTNTTAIVVAVALLDAKSRKLIPATAWANLTNGTALPDPNDSDLLNNVLMDTTWNRAVKQSAFSTTYGIPTIAASHIRIYQRYYYLNSPKVP